MSKNSLLRKALSDLDREIARIEKLYFSKDYLFATKTLEELEWRNVMQEMNKLDSEDQKIKFLKEFTNNNIIETNKLLLSIGKESLPLFE